MNSTKWILFVGYICFATLAQGQLYYFTNTDSTLVGVRNAKGDTIIEPSFPIHGGGHGRITEPTVEFNLLPTGMSLDFSRPAAPIGAVYDLDGHFLYYPQEFDNGPDYWVEGVRRYVHEGKMGFVDRLGYKITEANWDFVIPFNYGYAIVYDSPLKKVYEQGGERWHIAPKLDRDTLSFHLIDRNGHRVHPLQTQQHEKDYFLRGSIIHIPFITMKRSRSS